MRIRPSARVGVAVLLAYLVAFYGVWILTGVDYDSIGDDAGTLLRWYAAPLAAGAVVLVVAATWLGWWRPALREAVRAPRWTLATPVLMLLLGIAVLAGKDFSNTTATMWLLLLAGSIGVGFGEELSTRGLLVVGLRGSVGETATWFWSCLLFGLLHLPNWVFGEGPGALLQVVLAFGGGSTFYLLRRGSGLLVWAMLLHGFWDFSGFAGEGTPAMGYLSVPLGAVSVVVCVVLLRRRQDTVVTGSVDRSTPSATPS